MAVKRGDLDGSWMPSPGVAPSSRSKAAWSTSATTAAGISVVVDSVVGGINDLVRVNVLISGCTNLTSMQFSLGWDTNLLSFQRVGSFGVSGIGPGSFGPLNPATAGRLRNTVVR